MVTRASSIERRQSELTPQQRLEITAQNERYTANKLTAESVQAELLPMLRFYRQYSDIRADWKYGLYVRPSDSLPLLASQLAERPELLGDGRALTVASSGEFATLLADGGFDQVDVFDVSAPACFLTEAKMAAGRILSREQYKKLFHLGDQTPSELFDPKLYLKIRPYISAPAQTYFDCLGKEDDLRVFKRKNEFQLDKDSLYIVRRRSRVRVQDEIGYLKNDSTYADYQQRLRQTQVWIQCIGLDQLAAGQQSRRDYAYMSNIGMEIPQLVKNACLLLATGAAVVGFTIPIHEHSIGQSHTLKMSGLTGKIGPNRPEFSGFPVSTYRGQELLAGTTMELQPGVQIRLVRYAPGAEVPLYAELHRADNPTLPSL
ncbi:MAG: hypothetical protein HYV33_05690 [Candidatus Kerfeldbacteria bacterium]|nr:hypothetical protein [Candidatus Kerfeldbacteria bacterium]